MAAQLPRPGVEIIQEFRSTSPTIVIPTLVPCNVAPFFEIIEVLNADGTLNADSKLDAPYVQLGLTIAQSSFPSPRGNIDQVDVQEDTIRSFLAHGGSLLELSRESGFLIDINIATKPSVTGTGTATFDLDAKKLIIALDSHIAVGGTTRPTTGDVPTANNVTIEFEADAMTLQEVVDFINGVVPDIASISGPNLQLSSTIYGASASVTVRSAGSANTELGFSSIEDQIAVGAGLYATDDGDSDLQSPRIEIFPGSTQRDLSGVNIDELVGPALPTFDALFIESGDNVVANGVDMGQVQQVFSSRLVMSIEQDLFGSDIPFAPRYVWVQGNNLEFPAEASSVAATQTGTIPCSAETSAYVVGQAAFGAVGAGESLDVDIIVNGVTQTTETVGSGAGWATLADAITGLNTASVNFEAYPANDVGDEVDASVGTYVGLRTLATNRGSDASITVADASAGMLVLGFTTVPVADVGENVRYTNGLPARQTTPVDWVTEGPAILGETNDFDIDVLGVTKPTDSVAWIAGHPATLPGLIAAIADWNAQALYSEAYASNAVGVEETPALSSYFSVRTRGENVGTTAILDFDLAGSTESRGLFLDPPVPGTDSDLNGEDFKWKVDGNPKEYQVLFATDEDDGGVSLQQVIDAINGETPNVASASSSIPPALKLTSGMLGEASEILVTDGTANDIGGAGLGFTDDTDTNGDGRPLPDMSVDISGNVLIQNQILRNGLTGEPFSGGGAPLHISYKALRLDVSPDADEPALLVINSTTQLESIAAPISTDNPGALMTFLTLLNSPGTAATAIGVPEVSADAPEGTPIGYAKALEFLESEEVYALSLGTQLNVVHQAGLTHVNFMSEPEQKGERILFFNPLIPSRRQNTLLSSGGDANSTPTVGKITVEENLAPALIEQGIDPANVNPMSGAIVNDVFLDLSSDDNSYLVQRVENGTDVFLRTTFAMGDGNEDQFYATTAPAGVISDDWTVAIRGTQLLLSDGSADKTNTAATIQAIGQAYGFRRGFYVFPEEVGINVTGLEQIVEGYYAASCVIGMVASLPPQQGFTNFPITGLTQVVKSNGYFSNAQLNVMAAGGVYILVQDAASAPVICRHQLSTDLTSIETRELSITKVVDFTAKFLRAGLRNFIGRSNITQSFLDQLSSVVQGILSFLIEAGVLIGADVNNVIQDADALDTVLIDVTLDVPYPANYLRVTLVV